LELQVGVNAVRCPICRAVVAVADFEGHLFEVHNLKALVALRPVSVAVRLEEEAEWGTPFRELGRQLVPKGTDVYNGEARMVAVDANGNPTPIPNPWEYIYRLVDEYRANGLRPQYIKIYRENVLVQCSGSPFPVEIIVLIAIAVAAVLFAYAFNLVCEALYRIFVAPIPPELRPFIIGGVLLIAALIVIGYFLPRKS
jgi:hypothetical protein